MTSLVDLPRAMIGTGPWLRGRRDRGPGAAAPRQRCSHAAIGRSPFKQQVGRRAAHLPEAEPPVQGRGSVEVGRAKANRQLALPSALEHLVQQRGSDPAALECRRDDDLAHVQLVLVLLDAQVAAGLAVAQHDRVAVAAGPARGEPAVLERVVPGPELPLGHLPIGEVMNDPRETRIRRRRRSKRDRHAR